MLKALKKYRAPYLFIMPFFILFLVFQLVPTIWTFYISLTNWKGIGTPDFCGFDNYRKTADRRYVLGMPWATQWSTGSPAWYSLSDCARCSSRPC